MADPLPTVTVAIPVLNCVRFVAEALESVLSQTYPPLEIIVVDDSSTDGTSEVVAGYARRGVRHMIRADQKNMYSAHNTAIRAARGELIAFLSADDIWLPEKLALQVALMAENPHLGYSTTHSIHFVDSRYPPRPENVRETHLQTHQRDRLETMVARKTLFERHGGFSEEYQISADVEWFARMKALAVPVGVVAQVLLHKRLHSDNAATRDPALTQAELLRILRKAARQRTAADGIADS